MNKKTKKQKEINKKIVETLKYGYSVKRRIHHGWKEWNTLSNEEKKNLRQLFGKYQYVYTSNIGEIDLVLLKNYLNNRDVWEIYSRETIFLDVQRFKTKKEAEKKIKELLLK